MELERFKRCVLKKPERELHLIPYENIHCFSEVCIIHKTSAKFMSGLNILMVLEQSQTFQDAMSLHFNGEKIIS